MIAAASTSDKRRLALELGADTAVDSEPTGYADRVRAFADLISRRTMGKVVLLVG